MGNDYVTVTEEFLAAGLTGGIGCKREQGEILGEWPLTGGWQKRVIGTLITAADAERFLQLRGKSRGSVKLTITKEQAIALMTVLQGRKEQPLMAVLRTLEWATR